MSAHQSCVVAVYKSAEDADIGLQVLEKSRYTNETVSIATKQSDESVTELERLKKVPDGSPPTEASAGLGGAVGGTIGAMLGTATLIGPFMIAGPLAGMAIGAGAVGLASATEKWGVKKDVTRDYERRVSEGGVLILVTGTDVRLDEAQRLLKTTGPESLERF